MTDQSPDVPRPLRYGENGAIHWGAEWPMLLCLPVLALLIVLPLLRNGPSCGHDFGFHMQSWMDASAQMRHGVLLPDWAQSPAFNAGEPRFVFYPPASWLLGSVLLLLLPPAVVPAAYTWVALVLAGWGMYGLGRRFAEPASALLSATIYLVNPYLLFTAFERTAYAELLAAAWLPSMLRAVLEEVPRPLAIALPIALLWLTNAPAAVMGTYLLGFAMLLRLGLYALHTRRSGGELRQALPARWPLVRNTLGGLLLGLGLSGFYLVPAAYERRFVQIAMAIIPNMRVEDNFLFGHTGYGPHDAVLHTASMVAVEMIALAAVALGMAGYAVRMRPGTPRRDWAVLATVALAVALLMLPFTLPLWHHLPELVFLQFPWRWLAVLGCVLGGGAAIALARIRVPPFLSGAIALVVAGLCGPAALGPLRQGCEAHELPMERVALFRTHHGVGPTDEYTPGDADNDQLRWDNPAWWLAAQVNDPGPGTVPNPAATIVDYDVPPPLEQTVSGQAPMTLQVRVERATSLVLNLRAYPAWEARVNGRVTMPLQRDDGLMALPLPAGSDKVTIRWRRLPDVVLGDSLTWLAVVTAAFLAARSRRIRLNR